MIKGVIFLILLNIRSAYNVGSIFRTADATGISKIYLTGYTPTPLNAKVQKTSLGAEKTVPWEKVELRAKPRTVPQSGSGARVKSITSLLVRLKQDGYKILAIEQDKKAIPFYKFKIAKKQADRLALVVGSEVLGLPSTILKRCDKILKIPMRGRKESLNVSVAFGIVIFYLLYAR